MPTIRSADGTRLDVTSTGSGPGLVVIPGGLRRSHHYRRFAESLADSRTVHVIERRGRGDSGPQGPGYSIDQEVEDALAVLDATASAEVFGHSYGGLVGLHVALRRELRRLVVYEPAASIGGSLRTSFLGAFERRLDRGRAAAALATFLTGLGFAPSGVLALPAYTALAWFLLHTPDGREIRQLLPTLPAELRIVAGLDSDGSRYAAVTAPTMIIAGGRSPDRIRPIPPRLAEIMPHARYVLVPELDHNAPDESAPATVADLVRAFLTTDDATAR